MISLPSIFQIEDVTQYKVHFARWNNHDQPLDVFVRDREEWNTWNTWRNRKDEFNRTFVFSLMSFFHEPEIWLFGGIYRILAREEKPFAHSYRIEAFDLGKEMVGRLKIRLKPPGRLRAGKLENYFGGMEVSEILREPYSGEAFCGYDNIAIDFPQLESIFKMCRPDWKAALENVKGVYVIFDKSNGMKYVGSAYGDTGIWERWSTYVKTGHGWNDELKKIIDTKGIGYARSNFKISLLEYRPMRTDDKIVIEREGYWKEALLSRGEYGYNKN